MVRTNATELERKSIQACRDFECGLARDNVDQASKLISEGGATLRISVYPWGDEFAVVRKGPSDERKEGNPGAVV